MRKSHSNGSIPCQLKRVVPKRNGSLLKLSPLPADVVLEGVFVLEPLLAKPVRTIPSRRSQRLLLAVHVVVSGKQVSGLPFAEDALTQVVNTHGALVLMKHIVSSGDHLQIKNANTGEEVTCTVVDIGERLDYKSTVGVEFDLPSPRFWRVSFPPDNWTAKSPEAKGFSPRTRPLAK
jgi:hypothetical protein